MRRNFMVVRCGKMAAAKYKRSQPAATSHSELPSRANKEFELNKPPPHAPSAEAPLCAAPDPKPRKPRVTMPRNACDTHALICGPIDTFPYSDRRVYTP